MSEITLKIDKGRMAVIVSEPSSEIRKTRFILLRHCDRPTKNSKASVKSSQKYFVHLNWIILSTNPR
jgi:hypothetical protein